MADNNTRNDGSGTGPSTTTPVNSDSSNGTRGEWPWWGQFALVLCAMVLAALFLIGLPYVVTIAVDGANESTRPDAARAWNAIVPSLLGLTTMTISGIFVFMTFRIDRGAKAEAREAAEKIAKKTADEIVKKEVEKIVESEIRKQLSSLLAEVENKNDVKLDGASRRMETRDEAFDARIDDKFAAIDQRLKERFEDADARIRERVEAADVRLNDRVTAAQDQITRTASIAQERMKRSDRDSR